jgi:DNA polymerase III delta prime subunit
MKQVQELIQHDKLISQQLRSMIGNSVRPEDIRLLQNRLSYEEAERLLEEVKATNFGILSSKIIKAQKDIDMIRKADVQVCQYLMTVDRFPKVVKEKVVKEKKRVLRNGKLDFSDMSEFDRIGDERIPIVISKEKVIDLVKMPHLLVAGSTGSGKSVFLNVAILSILSKMTPGECQLALIDPKRVEFCLYRDVPHLFSPIVSEVEDIDKLLTKLINEMNDRYDELKRVDVKSIDAYNKQEKRKLPYIVVVIDELADLMMVSGKGVSDKITRLAQLARAAGIHMIMATQRPVAEIMTGLIKANMPARVAFRVESKQDSRIILDEGGAEMLMGKGELLFKSNGRTEKHQGLYVEDDKIKKVCRGK